MMRDPDLDLAIAELRPVFAKMRAERAKLRHEKVRNNLNTQAAVSSYVRELASEIGLRADRIGSITTPSLPSLLPTLPRSSGRGSTASPPLGR